MDDAHRRAADSEILRLRNSVHELVAKLQEMAVKQSETHGATQIVDVRLQALTRTIDQTALEIPKLVTASAMLDRRVWLLERAVFGFITIVLVAVITAWVKGIIILPHTAG